MIDVGVARVDVEVPVGTPMWGYAARTGPSTGTHDPLTVRALVYGEVGHVVVDCCALAVETCATIRERSGLAEAFVSATHTHAGPCLVSHALGEWSEPVHDAVVDAAVRALAEAYGARVPCRVTYGERRGLGVAKNRRHLDRTIDPPLQALGFHTDAGLVAALVSYPCHPVVLDAGNREISADYPWLLRGAVEDAFPGATCVFATGCAGDVNDGHPAEASFAAESAAGRTFSAVAEVGRHLGAAAVAALREGVDVRTDEGVRWASSPVTLPLETLDQAAVAADRDRWRATAATSPTALVDQLWAEWADRWLATAEHRREWTARVGLVRLGDRTVATLPCEPLLALAESIQAVIPGAIVQGYTDGVAGYLPPAEEFPYGGYEVSYAHRYYGMDAPFALGAAETVVDAVLELSRTLP